MPLSFLPAFCNQKIMSARDAADALLNEYKSSVKPKKTVDSASTEGLEEARKIGLETAAQDGSGESGRYYRRADLIELKLKKPHIYADPEFQREILKAYAEKRVK